MNKRNLMFFFIGLGVVELFLFLMQVSINLRIYDNYGYPDVFLAANMQQVLYVQVCAVFIYLAGYFINRIEQFSHLPDPKSLTDFGLKRIITQYQDELNEREGNK